MSKRYVFTFNTYANFNDGEEVVVYVNDGETRQDAANAAQPFLEDDILECIWDFVNVAVECMDNRDDDISDDEAKEVLDERSDGEEPVKRMFFEEINAEEMEERNARVAERERSKQSEVMTAIASTWD